MLQNEFLQYALFQSFLMVGLFGLYKAYHAYYEYQELKQTKDAVDRTTKYVTSYAKVATELYKLAMTLKHDQQMDSVQRTVDNISATVDRLNQE